MYDYQFEYDSIDFLERSGILFFLLLWAIQSSPGNFREMIELRMCTQKELNFQPNP
jgi:hypothetical protein